MLSCQVVKYLPAGIHDFVRPHIGQTLIIGKTSLRNIPRDEPPLPLSHRDRNTDEYGITAQLHPHPSS